MSSTLKVSMMHTSIQPSRTMCRPLRAPMATATVCRAHSRVSAVSWEATRRHVLSQQFRSQGSVFEFEPAKRKHAVVSKAVSLVRAEADAKKTVVITGASSGLGLWTAKALTQTGEWHVVMACRDFLKAETVAKQMGFPKDSYSVMHLDLSCLNSVRSFVDVYRSSGRPLDALVANAAFLTYQVPKEDEEPRRSAEGYELSVATNHLGHFLLANLMIPDLEQNPNPDTRLIILGTVTANGDGTGGSVPPYPDLGDLQGMKDGFKTATMIDGGEFAPVKAYKDSKLCNMMTMRELHKRFHDATGVKFMSFYPGCIAESALFREAPKAFQVIFPLFQKYITKGYVSEEEAGKRLAQVVSEAQYGESGAYWRFGGESGTEIFKDEPGIFGVKDALGITETATKEVSDRVEGDEATAKMLWELSEELVGLKA